MFFIKTLQYGSLAQPSTITKYQNDSYILRTYSPLPAEACSSFSSNAIRLHVLWQTAHAVFCQMRASVRFVFQQGLCRRIRLADSPFWLSIYAVRRGFNHLLTFINCPASGLKCELNAQGAATHCSRIGHHINT
jgi:hypothetical protein